MHILIATEIWGRTPHVDSMADTLRTPGNSVTVVDPYDGTDPEFASEDEAYSAFLEQCGHEEYAERVHQALANATGPTFLAGFSAGAGAVWAAISDEDTGHAAQAACFYGSSIRSMTDSTPQVPVDLIFPDHEPHFDVIALADSLQTKPLVQCHIVPAGHGFMNPLSSHYDKALHQHWSAWLRQQTLQPK